MRGISVSIVSYFVAVANGQAGWKIGETGEKQEKIKKLQKGVDFLESVRYNKNRRSGTTPKCGCSSSGRAPPCQGGGSEFEPRHPLHFLESVGKALPALSVCNGDFSYFLK